MTCIRTGCDVYLAELGVSVHGDLYEVGDCYILTCGGPYEACGNFELTKINLEVFNFQPVGTRSVAMRKLDCSPFSYDKRELIRVP